MITSKAEIFYHDDITINNKRNNDSIHLVSGCLN